jgi:hypothetical protein
MTNPLGPFRPDDDVSNVQLGASEGTHTQDGTAESGSATVPAETPAATPDCSAQSAAVETLKQQFNALAEKANSATGQGVWPVLCELGEVARQLAQARQALAACLESAAASPTPTPAGTTAPLVTGTLLTVAGCSGAAPGAQEATLWDLTDPTAGSETVPIANGQFGFSHQLAAQAAITVATTGEPEVTGLDFRSLPRSGPTTAPLHLEVVLGPTVTITVAELNAALAALTPLVGASLQGSGVDVIPTIATLRVELSAGVVSVLAGGTITGTVMGFPLASLGFSGRADLRLAPATTPDSAQIIDVELTKPVDVQFSGSLLASLASALSPMFSPLLAAIAMAQLRDEMRRRIPAAVADGFALAALPATCTLTLRSMTVSEQAITLQPALGCVGDALSTYDPPPIAAV